MEFTCTVRTHRYWYGVELLLPWQVQVLWSGFADQPCEGLAAVSLALEYAEEATVDAAAGTGLCLEQRDNSGWAPFDHCLPLADLFGDFSFFG